MYDMVRRPMRADLRNEVLRILEELSKGEGIVLHFGDQGLTFEAVYLLAEYGAVEEQETGYYRVTISGYDYYQKLKAPRVYWAKKNWFPVAVLIVSSAVPVLAKLVEIWLG